MVSEQFSDHWRIRRIASKPTELKGRAGVAYAHRKQFLTWVAAQDTCGVTNWPPIEGLLNPDFKSSFFLSKLIWRWLGFLGLSGLKDVLTHTLMFCSHRELIPMKNKNKTTSCCMYKGVFWPPVLQKEKLYPESQANLGRKQAALSLEGQIQHSHWSHTGGPCPPPLPVPLIPFHWIHWMRGRIAMITKGKWLTPNGLLKPEEGLLTHF